MKCDTCREELELQVGQSRLPNEIAVHLENCPTCRQYWAELSGLTGQLAADEAFHPTELESALVESGVRRRIQSVEQTRETPVWWFKYAAVAAVAVLVAGVGWVGQRQKWFDRELARTDSVQVAQVTTDSNPSNARGFFDLNAKDVSQLDLSTFDTTDLSSEADDVLDSLSDAELQYLEKHLDVKGLL